MSRHLAAAALWVLVACGEEAEPPTQPPTPAAAGTQAMTTTRERPAPRHRLSYAMPSDTLLTMHLPDLGGAWQRLRGTVFGELYSEAQLEAFLDQLESTYRMVILPAAPGGGVAAPSWTDVEDVLGSLNGEFMVALLDLQGFDKPMPELRLLTGITVRGVGDKATMLLNLLCKLLGNRPGVTTSNDGDLWCIDAKNAPDIMEVRVFDDILLFGIGEGVVAEGVRRMKARQAEYEIPAARRCFHEHDIVRVHLNLAAVASRYIPLLPEDVRTTLSALGIDKLRGSTMATRIEDKGFVTSALYDSPGGKDIVTRCLAATPVNYELLAVMPSDVDSFNLFTLDATAILRNVLTAVSDDTARQMNEGVAALKAVGVDLGTILSTFGPQCAQVGLAGAKPLGKGPTAFLESFLNHAWLVQVRNTTAASKLLARIPAANSFTRREYDVGTAKAVTYDLSALRLPVQLAPSFALADDVLVLALTEGSLRAALKGGTPDGAARLKSRLHGVPATVSSVAFDSLTHGPGLIAAGILAGLEQSGATEKARVFREASRELPAALAYTTASQAGVFSYSRSPTGAMNGFGGITGMAIIAAIALPNVLQAKLTANESAAIAKLRGIRAAQEQFKVSKLRDRNGNGIGEYAFLGELMDPPRGAPLLAELRGAKGRYIASGYLFRTYLPGSNGTPIAESKTAVERVDMNLAENHLVTLAWPVTKGKTGNRSFLIDGRGHVYACSDGVYGGRIAPPPDILCSQLDDLDSQPIGDGALTRDTGRWWRVR